MIVLSDTSVVSNLFQLGKLNILQQLYGTVYIPHAVYEELVMLPTQAEMLKQNAWIRKKAVQNPVQVKKLLEQGLDIGEAEAITLALESAPSLLLIDEYKGREIAHGLGLKITGILGVLIQAKVENKISQIAPLIEKLTAQGFRLNPSLIAKVLQKVGE